VLQHDPDNIQALLWLAGVAGTRDEKDRVLQHVLRLDPDNKMAQQGLQALSASQDDAPNEPMQPTARSRRRGPRTTTTSNNTVKQRPAAASAAPPAERDMVVLGAANSGDNDKRGNKRRGSLFWLLGVPLLLALIAGGVWYWQNRDGGDEIATASNAGLAETNTSVADAILASPSTTGAITSTTIAGYPAPATGATDTAEGSAPITGTTTINIPGVPIGGASPPASAAPSASASVVAAAPSASTPPASASAAPSVVAVAPSASPAPSVASSAAPTVAPSAAPSTSPAPGVVAVAPSASPAPSTAPPAPSVVAVAPVPAPSRSPAPSRAPSPSPAPSTALAGRPTLLPAQQLVEEGPWRWSSYGLSNVLFSADDFRVQPNGRYLVVLALVQNTGTTPQQIPDGLFVVTDEQGRTATFNRQASVDYYQQYRNTTPGDYPANAAIPVTTTPVSVPLLFDLPLDSTNVVLTSANNPQQGFFVAQRMQ
jgi:hypothetical protein